MSSQNHNRLLARSVVIKVVSYSVSTSNHNYSAKCGNHTPVVPYSVSTSNHNIAATTSTRSAVVPYSVSTSNHNVDSKPHKGYKVVPYSVSTSNHNTRGVYAVYPPLFLILFLHQTTTGNVSTRELVGCSLFCFYIKPQLVALCGSLCASCSLFCFYIKPQLRHCASTARPVVPYSVSTSNHNFAVLMFSSSYVVPYSVSTSNHNYM